MIVPMKKIMDTKEEGKGASGSGHKAGRKSYTLEEKLRVVAETQELGASVSRVARAHDINANLVFTWRRQHARGELVEQDGQSVALIPVEVKSAARKPAQAVARIPSEKPKRRDRAGLIEIDLPRASVRIHGHVDSEVLRQILAALRAR